jgi:hypothetical protein
MPQHAEFIGNPHERTSADVAPLDKGSHGEHWTTQTRDRGNRGSLRWTRGLGRPGSFATSSHRALANPTPTDRGRLEAEPLDPQDDVLDPVPALHASRAEVSAVKLPETIAMSGLVVDDLHRPIEGATVELVDAISASSPAPEHGLTAADGSFSFEAMPIAVVQDRGGRKTVRLRVGKVGYADDGIRSYGVDRPRIVLARVCSIFGTVSSAPDGLPLVGALVTVKRSRYDQGTPASRGRPTPMDTMKSSARRVVQRCSSRSPPQASRRPCERFPRW